MKLIILTIAIMIALPALIICQTNVKSGGDEQAVRKVLNDLEAALGKNDRAGLDRIYADSYTFTSEKGVMTTKAQRLDAFKAGELKYEYMKFDDVNVRMYGDTAVATFTVRNKLIAMGQSTEGTFRTTATFVKKNGRWQEVAAQSSTITVQ